MKHLLTLKDLGPEGVQEIISLAQKIKSAPQDFSQALRQKTLLMIFEKPSLRTRLSFEAGMTKLGGHAIYYDTRTSPMGSGKESVSDTIKVASRFVDIIMARLFKHSDLEEMADVSNVPVINGLTNFNHPCQILADLLTIHEVKGELKGKTLCYLGDSNNNVTHSLMMGAALAGMHMRVACPARTEYSPAKAIIDDTSVVAHKQGGSIKVYEDAHEAAQNSDVIYTDTWMSYHIEKDAERARLEALTPYQVNNSIMDVADPDAIFMNCLPALRGYEQTAAVIDGPQSVVFDQAENRMWAQNAVLVNALS